MKKNKVRFLARITSVPGSSFFHGGPLALQVDDAALTLVKNELFDHNKGDQFLVTLEDPSGHSERQRNIFHALVGQFSRQQGLAKESVKQQMKHRHGVSETITTDGVDYLWLKSTADYTKDEYTELIEGTINDCVEAQVDIEQFIAEWRGMK
jgi:hypothetical protein